MTESRVGAGFSIVDIPAPAEYVSLLGAVADKTGLLAVPLTFTGVAVTTDESIFVGVAQNAFPGQIASMSVTDNLGNIYTLQSFLEPGLCTAAVFAANPSVAGTISTITVNQPAGAPIGIVAGRFRYVGASVASTQETSSGPNYGSGPNAVLTQAGPTNGIGISCYGVRTTGSISFGPGTLVGYASTSGGADSSNIDMGLGYVLPVTASGITGLLFGDPTRAWVHAGKSYDAA